MKPGIILWKIVPKSTNWKIYFIFVEHYLFEIILLDLNCLNPTFFASELILLVDSLIMYSLPLINYKIIKMVDSLIIMYSLPLINYKIIKMVDSLIMYSLPLINYKIIKMVDSLIMYSLPLIHYKSTKLVDSLIMYSLHLIQLLNYQIGWLLHTVFPTFTVGAASQWCSNERMMVYFKLMMVKCSLMMVKC